MIPKLSSLDTSSMNIDKSALEKLFEINTHDFKQELPRAKEFFNSFGDRIPKDLMAELDAFEKRLSDKEKENKELKDKEA